MYQLPSHDFSRFKKIVLQLLNNRLFQGTVLLLVLLVAGFVYLNIITLGSVENQIRQMAYNVYADIKSDLMKNLVRAPELKEEPKQEEKYVSDITYEQAIINTVASASPSVVSIVISKNVPVYEQQFINPFGDVPGINIQIPQNVQKGTKYQEVGAGSGFIVSEDGLIVTNKHVVLDKKADYTVVTSDGKKYSAKVLAIDPVEDLAIIKIEKALALTQEARKFPAIKLGDSDGIVIGQGAIAIGNSLGEFKNTVSVGIVSGLQRTVSATGGDGFSETLEGVIQTDAAINPGNSGGPLLNLKGEVIGVNTAMANGAQTIGFAIPINIAKRDIAQVQGSNKIVYPFLGVRYVLINDSVKEKYKLSVSDGAYVVPSDKQPSIVKDSAAEKAGIKEKDIILEVNGEKITEDNSMAKIIQRYNPGDKVTLKVLRQQDEMNIEVTLGERN
jgi:S1-C subfamily serine protease